MIQLFKTNSPSLYGYLILYLLVLTAIHFIHPEPYQGSINEPLSQLLFYLLHLIPLPAAYTETVLSIVLLYLNALLINALVFRYKIFDISCQLPGLIYLLVACSFESWSQLSPVFLSNTILILMLERIIALSRKEFALVAVFDLGVLVAVGSLLFFPFIAHFLTVIIGLLLMRSFVFREWLDGLAGLLTPFLLTAVYYYWQGSLTLFFDRFFLEPFYKGMPSMAFDFSWSQWLIGALFVGLLLISLFNLQRLFLKSTVQLRKSYTLIIWSLGLSMGSLYLQTAISFLHFSSIAVPLALIATHFFMTTEQKKIVEPIHTVLVVLILIIQYQRLVIPNFPFL